MSNNRWTLAAVWLLLCATAPHVAAASNEVLDAGLHYTVKTWGADEGLPQSSVFALTQTRDGYLWLGTLNGLVRFDGIRFTDFDPSTTPGLKSSRIFHLFEDSHGNLWIGTEDAGVALAKTNGQVSSLDIGRGAGEKRLTAACEDSNGAVWLYTANGELARYRGGIVDVWNAGSDRFSSCRALIAEKNGPLWLGTDWALFAIGITTGTNVTALPVEQILPVKQKLDFLLASQRDGHWRLIDGRIQKWTTNRLEKDFGAYPWTNAPVTAACEDREGNLIVGTYGNGVYWFDADGKFTRLSGEQGLSHDSIVSLTVDREGSLWVGSNGGGLNRVKRPVFGMPEFTRGSTVQTVCEDAEGGLWIGYNGDRLDHWNAEGTKSFSLTPNAFVKSVFVDRNQQVWAGVWSAGGPRLFQFQNGRFQPAPGLAAINQDVSAIYQDRNGLLWVGTRSGLARWDGRDWKTFTGSDELSSEAVQAIAEDREGNLWIGTARNGLKRLRDGKFTSFHRQDGLPGEDVSSLLADQDGMLWIGTSKGLVRLHNGKWTRYTLDQGLVSNSIGYLIEDGQGSLWIGSNAGLMRVAREELNDFADGMTNVITCRAYGKPDGLPTRECTFGSQPGAWRTRDGKLWFPTTKGLTSVNPARLNPNTNPPPVIIESVLIEGREQNTNGLRAPPPQTVTVPAGKERLEIKFTSLNLAAPDQARFKYRMADHETTWTEAVGNVRPGIARYTKLPPGDYRFQVTAGNEDGEWNPTDSSLAVIVEPPFWMTWWFRTATGVFLLGIVGGGVHYVSTQKLHRQLETLRQQEALERERARIARDIHDQLGASLTQVSLLGELVEGDKNSPAEVESHAKQICQTALDTTRALDEIVWTVNPSNDTLDGLITYVCKYAQEFLAVAGLRYRLDVPAQLPNAGISPEVRHNVFLAAKEAVTNVVRHAQASAVHIRLKLEPARFTLEIEDNGRGVAGMDEKAAQSRNGLRNMRKRMEDVGGVFSISPAPEGGTVVRLTAPFRNH